MVHQSTLPSLENNFLLLAQNDPHYAYLSMAKVNKRKQIDVDTPSAVRYIISNEQTCYHAENGDLTRQRE